MRWWLGRQERVEEGFYMQLILKVTLNTGKEMTKFVGDFREADNFMHNWHKVYAEQIMRWNGLNIPYHAVAYWEVKSSEEG